jgi:hypothetical protein
MQISEEHQRIINRQISRCIRSISQVIEPHEIIEDSIKLYMNYLAKDLFSSIPDNIQKLPTKYEHKRFD